MPLEDIQVFNSVGTLNLEWSTLIPGTKTATNELKEAQGVVCGFPILASQQPCN